MLWLARIAVAVLGVASSVSSVDLSKCWATTANPPTLSNANEALVNTAYRGLYVSLNKNQAQLEPYNTPAVLPSTAPPTSSILFATSILNDAAGPQAQLNRQRLLRFIVSHQINALSFYDLYSVLADRKLTGAMQTFMAQARQCGVTSISAIGGSQAEFASIGTYLSNSTLAQAHKFDMLLTEIEYWNAGSGYSVDSFATLAQKHSHYLGWFIDPNGKMSGEQAIANVLIPLLDRVYLHSYYGTDPSQAYGYTTTRLTVIQNAMNPSLNPNVKCKKSSKTAGCSVEIVPIFSAEGVAYKGASLPYLGDWFRSRGVVAPAEAAFLSSYAPRGVPAWNAATMVFKGFQYFAYEFLGSYMPL
ncbi:hypothetical protein AC1031_018246 [Aphanomyces cochlioides]|nr:hypothetical protein AC1031_018246 [Aphanomyces cochlioides]